MHIDAARGDDDFRVPLCRYVRTPLVKSKVARSDREFLLKQAFIDGAELAHTEAPEIDRPEPFRPVVQQKRRQYRPERPVRYLHTLEERPKLRDIRVVAEESPVVGGHAPRPVSVPDRLEDGVELPPQHRVGTEVRLRACDLEQVVRNALQRALAVESVGIVRKKVLVLGVRDEEHAKEEEERRAVCLAELFGPRRAERSGVNEGGGKTRYHIIVDTVTQTLAKTACEPLR